MDSLNYILLFSKQLILHMPPSQAIGGSFTVLHFLKIVFVYLTACKMSIFHFTVILIITASNLEFPSEEIPGKTQGNLLLVSKLEILPCSFPVGELMGNPLETLSGWNAWNPMLGIQLFSVNVWTVFPIKETNRRFPCIGKAPLLAVGEI